MLPAGSQQVVPMRLLPRILTLALIALPLAALPARAAEPLFDEAQLTQLEVRAEHAAAREQCFLFTELIHGYAQIAGKQLAEGDTEKASATLQRVQGFAARIHAVLARDTRQLKNAEMLVHNASRSLGECLHHASSDDKAMVASTLKQLDKVNEELLAQVFAH